MKKPGVRAGAVTPVDLTTDEVFDPHVPGIDYGVLDSMLGYAVRRAQIKLYEDFIASLAPWNITPPRYSALVIISRNPGLKLTELARILGITRSGAVMLIDTLQEMGYVERRPCDGDRRAYALVLTPQGEADLKAIVRAALAHDTRMAQVLTTEEREQLMGVMQRLAHAGARTRP